MSIFKPLYRYTLQNAIDYGGLATTFANENVGDYVFSTKDGTIVYRNKDIADKDVGKAADARDKTTKYQAIAGDWATKLGTLYGATTT